jgi:HK97 family phage prohead protease
MTTELSSRTKTAQSEPADGMFFRSFQVQTKSVDLKTRRVSVIASTETIDSHGEILEQVWDLTRYMANPVVLWNHNIRSESPDVVLGRGENVRVERPGTPQAALELDIVFASKEANPDAEKVLLKFEEGIQRAVSVGFRPNDIRLEMRDGEEVFVLSNNELRELSVTPVPSNPDTLAKELAYCKSHADSTSPKRGDDNPQNEDKSMQFEELKAALETEKAKREGLQKELDELKAQSADDAEKKALDAQTKRLAEERDAMKERAEAAEAKIAATEKAADDKLIEADLSAALEKGLFTPAELDSQRELRTSNKQLFEKLLSERTPLDLTKMKIGADPTPPNQHKDVDTNNNGADLAALVHQASVAG